MFHVYTLQEKFLNEPIKKIYEYLKVHHIQNMNKISELRKSDLHNASAKNAHSHKDGTETYKDTSRMENESYPIFHARNIMSSPVLTINGDAMVKEAWSMFIEKKVHHLPVLSDEKKMIGILSDRDIFKRLIITNGKIVNDVDKTVKEIMTTNVFTATPITDIRRIAKEMFDNNIDAMPIVDDGLLSGIITRSDILHAIIHQPDLQFWA